MGERIIRSRQRVKERGEVFTPANIVRDMLDLIPSDAWTIDARFLDPACGNGNFLVQILERKLAMCVDDGDAVRAAASVYGIDIMPDNVDECRSRLSALVNERFPLTDPMRSFAKHIIVGDSLTCNWEEAFDETL